MINQSQRSFHSIDICAIRYDSLRRNSSTFTDASNARPVVENRIFTLARENEESTWYFIESEVRFKGSISRVTYEERFARYEIHIKSANY